MKKLSVEANNIFYYGFVLNEQELRRLVSLIQDQLSKETEESITTIYIVKYENGVVEETNDIEEIFTIENSGSEKIIELKINSKIEGKREIVVDFIDASSDNVRSNVSIKYSISGNTRDWVLVTSSLIEERIRKVKRISIKRFFKNESFAVIGMLMIMLLTVFPLINSRADKQEDLTRIRKDYESGKLTDEREMLLQLFESDINSEYKDFPNPTNILLVFGSVTLLMIITSLYISKLYPIYNFCWGDYEEVFKKKEGTRKTINWVVLVGLAVSIVAGFIVNFAVS